VSVDVISFQVDFAANESFCGTDGNDLARMFSLLAASDAGQNHRIVSVTLLDDNDCCEYLQLGKSHLAAIRISILKVMRSFTCIGGPLNDNILKFSSDQKQWLTEIHESLRDIVDDEEKFPGLVGDTD
jgi:hypothetical protein